MENILNMPSEETLERIADALENNAQSEVDTHNTDVNAHEGAIKLLHEISYEGAHAHNSIYRGKYLGNSYTPAQQAAVANGTFEDLYPGDYWTIGGINYRIMHLNYFVNMGDSLIPRNHLLMTTDKGLYTHVMNETNITTGGYVGSKMFTEGLASALTTIKAAFGNKVLKHRRMLTNATTDGKASGWAWTDVEVCLMNEAMVYGSSVWGVSTNGNGYNTANGNGQLAAFFYNRALVHTRYNYWLLDVVSSVTFARVGYLGHASSSGASNAGAVRPYFLLS